MWVDMNVYICCSVIVTGLEFSRSHTGVVANCAGVQCHSTTLTMPFPYHFQLYVNYNCVLKLIMFQVGVLPLLLLPTPGSRVVACYFHT